MTYLKTDTKIQIRQGMKILLMPSKKKVGMQMKDITCPLLEKILKKIVNTEKDTNDQMTY
jgi:hypothetical protein